MCRRAIIAGIATVMLVGGAPRLSSAATTVHVGICSISPDTLTIPQGEEVIWRVPGGVYPQFTAIPAGVGVQVKGIEGGDYAATFDTPGEYRYVFYCPRGDRGDSPMPAEITVR